LNAAFQKPLAGIPKRTAAPPLRAYAQPIYSGRRFIPVDSEFERTVLRELLEARRYFDRYGSTSRSRSPFSTYWHRSAPPGRTSSSKPAPATQARSGSWS